MHVATNRDNDIVMTATSRFEKRVEIVSIIEVPLNQCIFLSLNFFSRISMFIYYQFSVVP